MEQLREIRFTADEFIAWVLQQPSGRYELDNGVVVAMAPERVNHAIAKLNAAVALRNAIGAQALPCQALPDGMSVKVGDRTVYEPDALVRCGPPLPGDAIVVDDPLVVVEVVSPSSRGIDRGAKLAGYFSVPSVRHYLIVDTDAKVVIH
ncbi:Uma2 family endonuclease, partial [Amaricoccus sp.]|uniref:Uma2 family endonuclease n=1 Tax=Amaricoccus sp. TaxID=1872485 RepID=UPI002633E796